MSEDSQVRCFVENINQTYQNITIYKLDDDLKHYSFVVGLVVTVFVFVSNTMLIYGLYKTNKKLSLIKKLFIYLSIIDIVTSCIEVITFIVEFYSENISCTVALAIISILYGLNGISFELLFNISVLRYLSIIRPFLRIRASHQKAVLSIEITSALATCTTYYFVVRNYNLEKRSIISILLYTLL